MSRRRNWDNSGEKKICYIIILKTRKLSLLRNIKEFTGNFECCVIFVNQMWNQSAHCSTILDTQVYMYIMTEHCAKTESGFSCGGQDAGNIYKALPLMMDHGIKAM